MKGGSARAAALSSGMGEKRTRCILQPFLRGSICKLEGRELFRAEATPPSGFKPVSRWTRTHPSVSQPSLPDRSLVSGLPWTESGPVEAAVLNRLRDVRSEEHTSELQSRLHLVCRLLLEKKKNQKL